MTRHFTRSLDQLDAAARAALRLGNQVGNDYGRVSELRRKLKTKLERLRLVRGKKPFSNNRLRKSADELFVAIIELVKAILHNAEEQ